MSRKLPVVSGEKMVKLLRRLGFEVKRQTASHIILQKDWKVFSVPLHDELKKGTLMAILKQADITVEEFKRIAK